MLYNDFISQFPPSNTGEVVERNGENLKVTWLMFRKINNNIVPTHAELKIDLGTLELDFSLADSYGKKTGHAIVEDEEVSFQDDESENFFGFFIDRVQSWFKTPYKEKLQ